MNKSQFTTPVLFIVFNRPDTTKKVFNEIRKVKPKKLFIAADGPRPNHTEDEIKCIETKKIVSQINWPCEVKTLFREKNLGCGKAPSSAISWFFDHVDQGIILEDDCAPSQSFFFFCQKLLEFYKHDSRVFHIGGTSYAHFLKHPPKSSYYFVSMPEIWGWATWKRAWEKYDFTIKSFPSFKENNIIKNIFNEKVPQDAWLSLLEDTYNKIRTTHTISAWDHQWAYTIFINNGLAITPTRNLICNIGFGPDATHTKSPNPILINNSTQEIDINNIKHPYFMVPNRTEEKWFLENVLGMKKSIKTKWKTKKFLREKFPNLIKLYKYSKKKIFKRAP